MTRTHIVQGVLIKGPNGSKSVKFAFLVILLTTVIGFMIYFEFRSTYHFSFSLDTLLSNFVFLLYETFLMKKQNETSTKCGGSREN